MINAPYYPRNSTIFSRSQNHPACTSITKTITRYRSRLVSHTSILALTLSTPINRKRLKRLHPLNNWLLGRSASGTLIPHLGA